MAAPPLMGVADSALICTMAGAPPRGRDHDARAKASPRRLAIKAWTRQRQVLAFLARSERL